MKLICTWLLLWIQFRVAHKCCQVSRCKRSASIFRVSNTHPPEALQGTRTGAAAEFTQPGARYPRRGGGGREKLVIYVRSLLGPKPVPKPELEDIFFQSFFGGGFFVSLILFLNTWAEPELILSGTGSGPTFSL